MLLEARADQAEAETWYARAGQAGHADSAFYLGMLREEQGASEEAEGWYRRAAEAGHEAAARKLGIGQATA